MTDAQIAALLGGLAGLLTAAAAWAASRQKTSLSADRAAAVREKTAVGQWREIAEGQQRSIEALQAHAAEQQEVLDRIVGEHHGCRVELAVLYGHLTLTHDFARRVAACCRRLGDDPGDPPEMPPPPARPDAHHDFDRRTLAQNTRLLSPDGQPPGHAPGGAS